MTHDGSGRPDEPSATGSHAMAAQALYRLSPYRVAPRLIRATALVKQAAAMTNGELGYLSADEADRIVAACHRVRSAEDGVLESWFPLDAYQGGAGTSINMALNEWIAREAGGLDPHAHVNRHQSTNDVMPTALRLMMHDALEGLEAACMTLQGILQQGETAYDQLLKPARTQLRDALVTSLGREYATWAHAVGRDRWRAFKARERIREVNLGATAVGTGAGAPRSYIQRVIRRLQELVPHPIARAEHLGEATSNWDSVVEAMEAPRSVAVNLRRIASDLRLLASGPDTAIGELRIPALLAGSSIMAGKVNPVIPEAVIQSAERILANDALLARLASMSELELNAFFPAIAHTVHESLFLAVRSTEALGEYASLLAPNAERLSAHLKAGYAEAVALLPLATYSQVERLVAAARSEGASLGEYLIRHHLLCVEEANALFNPNNLLALGYDDRLIAALEERVGAALRSHADAFGSDDAPTRRSDGAARPGE